MYVVVFLVFLSVYLALTSDILLPWYLIYGLYPVFLNWNNISFKLFSL